MRLSNFSDSSGFTLVEVLIAILISGFILAGLYTSFLAQQESFFVNERNAEMQENLRAAMVVLSRDIMRAGYDPSGDASCAGIEQADSGRLQIRMDLDGNENCGDANEDMIFGFAGASDSEPDGVVDAAAAADLGRDTGGGFQAIATDMQAIAFAYAYDADGDGQLDTSPNGNVIWAVDTDGNNTWDRLDRNDDGVIDATDADNPADTQINGADTGTTVFLGDVRAVRIWLLARSTLPDRDFTDGRTLVVGRNLITPNDSFYHRLLETTIYCRNMGL